MLGYWMRRPEPSVGLLVLSVAVSLVRAALTHNWALLLVAVPCSAAGAWVWMTRRVSRWNADRWRQGYHDVF
jgi:thiol:disulfide interchange protein